MPKREGGWKIEGLNRRSIIKFAPALLLPTPRVARVAQVQRGGSGAWPIRASANGRYLVTSGDQPYLLVADSAQSMIGNLLRSDAEFFLSTRAAQGFNAVQFDVVSTPYVGNRNAHHGTPDGVTPFSRAASYVASPNPAYFSRVDQYVDLCAQYGLLAILNPYEASTYGNGGGMPDLINAGKSACLAYGQYLGERYASLPNIAWQLGNDCKINNAAQFDVMQAMAHGIRSYAPDQLMVIELEYPYSTAFENTSYGTFRGLMNLNGAYTYGPTYGYSLLAYNNTSTLFDRRNGTNTSPPCPSILLEANYEFENTSGGSKTDGGTPLNLRKQSYWCMLSGQTGQIYGNGYIWGFETKGGSNIYYPTGVGGATGSWKKNLYTRGSADLLRWKNFFTSIPWWELVPDQTHLIGTSGYGNPAFTGLFGGDNYITLAATQSGRCAVAYFSHGRSQSLRVDMASFADGVTAQWFDPTNGSYSTISGSPFSNTGSRAFTPKERNGAGDPDWVLLLKA
jgi:hypothetical protein